LLRCVALVVEDYDAMPVAGADCGSFADARNGRQVPGAWGTLRPSKDQDNEGELPLGELTLTAGHGDVGKSTANVWVISNVTRGTLPGRLFGHPRNCLIAASEGRQPARTGRVRALFDSPARPTNTA
jgi:hypothetical protein